MERTIKWKGILSSVLIVIFFLSIFPGQAYGATTKITKVYNLMVKAYVNETYTMPKTVQGIMSDGKVKNLAITWEKKTFKYVTPGTFKLKGTIKGYKPKVYMTILVTEKIIEPAPVISPTPELIFFPVVKNQAQYDKNILYGLQNFIEKMEYTIEGYDDKTYSLERINDLIDLNPLLDYGYAGARSSMRFFGNGSTRDVELMLEYEIPPAEMLRMRAEAEKKAADVIAEIIKPNMSDLEKEKAIHDYIINHTVYDSVNFERNTITPADDSDYGVLIDGLATCGGYSKAMYRLCNMVGLECTYITGIGNGGAHAWNQIVIGGITYHVDVTFDDPIMSDGSNTLRYDYFNKTDEEMRKDHSW